MPVTASSSVCITPGPGHYTFGYYDRNPWNADLRYHLALKIPYQDHLPRPDDRAVVGLVDLEDGNRFLPLAETYAWNHQQGSMTMWLDNEPGCFIFNDAVLTGGHWEFISRVLHVEEGEVRRLPRPVYVLSPDGKTAATLDFGRIYFRKGYSYAGADSTSKPNIPDDDGVWLMDVLSGRAELICSIRQMADVHPLPHELKDTFVWLNHIGFNMDGSRLMVLFRYAYQDRSGWKTFLYTMGPDGGNLRCALPHPYWQGVSHQIWGRTPREILLDADWRRQGSEFVVFNDGETRFRVLAEGVTGRSGHLRFSPDGRWIVADTYPHHETHMQRLRVVNVATGEVVSLGDYYHDPKLAAEVRDIRCDLHPRWRSDSAAISFDSVMNGERKVYVVELAGMS